MSRSTKLSYAVSSLSLLLVAAILLLLLTFSLSFSFDDPSLRPLPTPVLTGTNISNNVPIQVTSY